MGCSNWRYRVHEALFHTPAGVGTGCIGAWPRRPPLGRTTGLKLLGHCRTLPASEVTVRIGRCELRLAVLDRQGA